MNKSSKVLFIASGIFLLYGYLCRALSIYFFWDSKAIGWILLGISMTSFVVHNANERLEKGGKVVIHMIAVLVLIFILGLNIVLSIVLKISADSYKVATDFLTRDSTIINQLGNVKGFSLFTTGSVSVSSDANGTSGLAIYELTVMGDRKYKDIKVWLAKDAKNRDWVVDSVE